MPVRPIILAEDNDKLRRMYTDMLEADGYIVMGASDGEKAIGLLHKITNPQMIILDVMMPRLDGIETCTRIRRMQGLSPCPILFLTALDTPETMLECLRAGGDDFLMKSAPMADVLTRVTHWTQRIDPEECKKRRQKAIDDLVEIVEEDDEVTETNVAEESASDLLIINELADFVNNRSSISEDEPLLCRFGYVVGLVDACCQNSDESTGRLSRFLRSLIYKTSCIDRKEINALLDNYDRIVTQNQFQKGWARGGDEVKNVGGPQVSRLIALLEENEIAK